MALDVKIDPASLKAVQSSLDRLSKGQTAEAIAKALNDTGFRVRKAMVAELSSRFDNPTPFIARSPKVVMATADKLSVNILPTRDTRVKPGTGKVDQQQILQAQEFGGQRRNKGSELVLLTSGLMAPGLQTVIPRDPFPGSVDARGNIKGPFIVKLLAYLQAYGADSNRKNLSDKAAKSRKDITEFSNRRSRRTVRLMDGWEFVVSKGLAAGGRGLAPGIWGKQDGKVKPVLLFVTPGNYTPLISMDRVAKEAGTQEYLNRRVRFRVRQAAEAL